MELHDVADNPEAKAEAGLAARSGIRLAEPFEDVGKKRGRDADAGVGHG